MSVWPGSIPQLLSQKVVKRFGFETNAKTRPVILSDLIALVREDVTIETDALTLKEMLTFVKNDKGRAEAEQGFHDDLVMALAIAHFISSQQTSSWIEIEDKQPDFIEENFNIHTDNGNSSFMDWDI